MKRLILTLVLLCGCFAQPVARPPKPGDPDSRLDSTLPNGKTQREMIVKDDYKKNLEDAAEMAKLAEDLKQDLENGDKYIVSVKAIKKAEDIERLARNIRNRLRRY
ncbi:MAG TPA: hypothetical protein VKX39_06840 [Bryobacteraceae bacterium]|jgi:hypothetical protein|nr:hypothetical protein [Bryobacteraceae bacterium]